MVIKVEIATYALVVIIFIVGLTIHLTTVSYGNLFTSGKRRGELGLWGFLMIVGMGIFTLIWGGFFWW